MRRESWNSLAPGFRRYAYTEAVGRFIERAAREMQPLALILFGSLARGDYHQQSDADFCVVLAESPPSPFDGYDQVVAYDPSGVVQPLVYGADQFRQMVRQANGLALEVIADGIFLAGDEAFRREIEALAAQTRDRLGIERTATGWRIARPELMEG
ncbi:MAG: nucleotidyltransferase domain-containing protein [Ardenticatenaceae bacterium]|nr:nucleotidyltransferase domain-containing protein [Ardenticatenaceae bacterium]